MDDLPLELTAFLVDRISSIEQLSVLRLLTANPARAWTATQISLELRSAPSAIERRLTDLYEAGVLMPPSDGANGVRFTPPTEEVAALVAQALEAYRTRPRRVIELVYSKPDERVGAFGKDEP